MTDDNDRIALAAADGLRARGLMPPAPASQRTPIPFLPAPAHWTRLPSPPTLGVYRYGAIKTGYGVVSGVGAVPGGPLEYRLAITKGGKPPTDAECARVLDAFKANGAEERECSDAPGARNFFLAVP